MVAETVRSALDQRTTHPFEVVVVDDGSTDETAQRLAEAYPAARVVRQPNRERGAARNVGVSASEGAFLSFVDSDDFVEPWHVAVMGDAALADGPHVVQAAPSALWDPHADTMRPVAPSARVRRRLSSAALFGNCLPLQGLLVSAARFAEVGGFPEDRALAASEDWVFLARLVAMAPVHHLDRVTVRIREHAGRSTHDIDQMVPSRLAACRLLLDDGIAGRPLDDASRRLVLAGTHRFCAAHYYAAGRMTEARDQMARAVDAAGWRVAGPSVARLWVQTWLGRDASRLLRDLRTNVRKRAARGRTSP
ncbi:MAG: glycosyltransferase family 2 protein [Acidimicrobiia bacterium]|nr:glycosyltransferase family 2 protein [Acidimicrobiia bacterium]